MAEPVLTYRGIVYPWQCDHVGHMNVMWYVSKFDEATWQLLATVGITPSYLRRHGRAMAAVHQEITYKHELRPGDLVTIRSGILEVREKVIRFFHEMVNDETGEVAALAVLTGVHMDAGARGACPFPEEIRARGRERIVAYAGIEP
jgi:acyl-CoA thioester hydrolase